MLLLASLLVLSLGTAACGDDADLDARRQALCDQGKAMCDECAGEQGSECPFNVGPECKTAVAACTEDELDKADKAVECAAAAMCSVDNLLPCALMLQSLTTACLDGVTAEEMANPT